MNSFIRISTYREFVASRKSYLTTGAMLTVLTIIIIYGTYYASNALSGNSDDLVYPYLFRNYNLHDVILPGQHSNILKFPLFILQAVLPYNFRTFSLINIGLVLVTILGWALLTLHLFGKKCALGLTMVLSLFLLGSPLFTYELVGTTIRNVEYPLALAFIICSGAVLTKPLRAYSRLRLLCIGAVGLIYSLVCAGDTFFVFTISASLMLTALILIFRADTKTRTSLHLKSFYIYIIAFTGLGFIIRLLVGALGIARLYTDRMFLPHILPLNHLAPSITTALSQLLDLFGANIFGQSISFPNSIIFVNFLLLTMTVVIFARQIFFSSKAGLHNQYIAGKIPYFSFVSIGVTFFVTFLVYILSDLAVRDAGGGHIISAGQDRYLSILPLLASIGLTILASHYITAHKQTGYIYTLCIAVFLLVIFLSLPTIKTAHTYDNSLRENSIAVARASKANGVQLIVSGYWYGASVRFWSHNQITFVTVAACNAPQPTYNNRVSWYIPTPSIRRSALIINRKGPDSSYWDCSDIHLRALYGAPDRVIHVNNTDTSTMWIYNHDIRNNIGPMSF